MAEVSIFRLCVHLWVVSRLTLASGFPYPLSPAPSVLETIRELSRTFKVGSLTSEKGFAYQRCYRSNLATTAFLQGHLKLASLNKVLQSDSTEDDDVFGSLIDASKYHRDMIHINNTIPSFKDLVSPLRVEELARRRWLHKWDWGW
jgi:hypothetical protein